MSHHEALDTTDEEGLNATTNESTTDDDSESFDLETDGKAEAKRLLRAVDADTERARAEAAVGRKREAVDKLNRQLTEAKQRRQQTRERIAALEYTVERLEDAGDEQLVMQRLEGGVSMSIPADERESVREDLCERKQQLEQRLEDIGGRIDAAERGLQKDRVALDHLRNHKDLVSEQ